jgi:putative transposase
LISREFLWPAAQNAGCSRICAQVVHTFPFYYACAMFHTFPFFYAQRQLERLASSLTKNHPGAAASLREGLEETLTLIALGIDAALYRTLRTTNPIENLNGLIAHYTRNVKRWKDGQMVLRWVASALIQAQRGLRAIRGYRDMKQLTAALAQRVPGAPNVHRKAA